MSDVFALKANPDLNHLISERIGTDWIADLDQLRRLEPYADDKAALNALAVARRANKQRLAELARRLTGTRSIRPRASTSRPNGCTNTSGNC